VSAKNKKADKIQVLKENESFALKTILQGTYNPGVKFLLPEGDPPYTPNRPESIPSTLEKQLKKMLYFVAPKGNDVRPFKRERIFIQLLEAIHPEDAKIVLQMKEKKPFKGITSAVVKEAFPSILP
jgi:hypothetical protein